MHTHISKRIILICVMSTLHFENGMLANVIYYNIIQHKTCDYSYYTVYVS